MTRIRRDPPAPWRVYVTARSVAGEVSRFYNSATIEDAMKALPEAVASISKDFPNMEITDYVLEISRARPN